MTPRRPALRWHGGKWILADWIISHFPAHRIYTEAYGGAGSVLMKKPRAYSEVYNDLDGEVVNLFRVLQSPAKASRLQELLALTPFSRKEYRLSYEESANPVESARRLMIRCFMGFGSNSHNRATKSGFRADTKKSGTTPARDWMNFPDHISSFAKRLQGVIIENQVATQILAVHDSPGTLHYLDPPYPLSTRGSFRHDYKFEMTDNQHAELAAAISNLKGMVVISGYRCDLYEDLYRDWLSVERKTFADGARERTEILWINDAARRHVEGLFA